MCIRDRRHLRSLFLSPQTRGLWIQGTHQLSGLVLALSPQGRPCPTPLSEDLPESARGSTFPTVFKTVVRLRSRGRGWVRFPCASASLLPLPSSALPVDRFGFRGWHGQTNRLALCSDKGNSHPYPGLPPGAPNRPCSKVFASAESGSRGTKAPPSQPQPQYGALETKPMLSPQAPSA